MDIQQLLQCVALATVSVGGILGVSMTAPPAIAQTLDQAAVVPTSFDQTELEDASRIVLIASPAGAISHQLLIVEQLTDERPCWSETAGVIDPLLLEFDFSGICRRSIDGNGYSLRMGGEDLALNYTLRIVTQDNQLVLIASSRSDFFAPVIEIGRSAYGVTSGFVKIELDPSWRLTRRSYEGSVLGHFYITNDIDINTFITTAASPGVETPVEMAPPAIILPPPAVIVEPQGIPEVIEETPIQVPVPPPVVETVPVEPWIEFNRESPNTQTF